MSSVSPPSGDPYGLSIARQKLRTEYESHRPEVDVKAYEANVAHAREVGDLLLRHVVQGKEKQAGVYGSSPPSPPCLPSIFALLQRSLSLTRTNSLLFACAPLYCAHIDLKILPTTEVGSNDSIRKAKTSVRTESERKSPFPNRLKAAGGARKA